jgi:beta-ribofuranosylaminobenzene 5'-phosphate synthase
MKTEKQRISENKTVEVIAPARLHLGFLDMNGSLGRKFGSIGLSLSDIATQLSVTEASEVTATGPSAQNAEEYAKVILDNLMLDRGVHIKIDKAIPEHAGLGSGTQLSLAVGTAITRLFGKSLTTRELAKFFHRGARSGIGIGTFDSGGFIVDGGRGESTDIPPVITHLPFPEEWRVLLVFDKDVEGINGNSEKQIFNELLPMTEEVSGRICRLVLMQVLPALGENNCVDFGSAITEIQTMVGEHFSDAQNGHYSSQRVAEIMHWLSDHGATGIGQSSWGPTGFAIYPNELEAYSALQSVRKNWQEEKHLDFCLCTARNTMADVIIDGQLPQDTILQSYQ